MTTTTINGLQGQVTIVTATQPLTPSSTKLINSNWAKLSQVTQKSIIKRFAMKSPIQNEKKIHLPYIYAVQNVNSRHKMKCWNCKTLPTRKRLFVSYKWIKNCSCNTVVHVYCQSCWSDFLKNCEMEYGKFLSDLREEMIK